VDYFIFRQYSYESWARPLRLFLRIALRIPTAHDFRVIGARSRARAHTQHIQNSASWFARDKSSLFSRKRVPGPIDFFYLV